MQICILQKFLLIISSILLHQLAYMQILDFLCVFQIIYWICEISFFSKFSHQKFFRLFCTEVY